MACLAKLIAHMPFDSSIAAEPSGPKSLLFVTLKSTFGKACFKPKVG